MNLDYVRNDVARMREQIRRQQNEIEMLSRAGNYAVFSFAPC
jgi:hypothetical protein